MTPTLSPADRDTVYVCALLLSLAFLFVWFVPAPAPAAPAETFVLDCTPLTDGTAEQWGELIANGWQGRADDSMEALYPPHCDA